ncbi:MAG: hypothetical protein EOR04_19625 [Mesorhizobium sp.]|uniref:hypothetical protein n=1 Tax=Mesorhizobium sp. TaxID=1871066 RepID=UPI000FE4CAEF|nr:hypothetical protein [Mesorhizobium sp.]RWP40158.1 MAG: hypothetical protein EOR04_19625 [Mesorhizobium sp.]
MATFQITGPDGKKYRVSGENAEGALKALQHHAGAAKQQHPEFDGSNIPGYDPATGEVSQPQGGMMDRAGAFAMSALEGLPLVGPSFKNVTQDIAALAAYPFSDQPLGDIRQEMAARTEQAQADNPGTAMTGTALGSIAGTVPMVAAAPAAFGAGGGGLLANSIIGALSGSALGGADAGIRSGGDPHAIESGALWGLGLGAAGPTAGRLVGSGVKALANRVGTGLSGAERAFTRAAGSDAVSDMAPRLTALGPDAMPMDLGPNLQRQAGALAAMPGRGQEIVRSAVSARDGGANARIGTALDSTIGKTPSIAKIEAQIKTNMEALGPQYGEAFEKARRVDTSKIAEDLESKIVNLRGDAQKAAQKIRQMLNVSGTDVLDPNPYTLFQTRQAIDGLLATEANPKVIGLLTETRKAVDNRLAISVPGIKKIDARFQELAGQRDAIQRGQQTLESGRTAPRPEELANDVRQGAVPAGDMVGPSAVSLRLREGARAEIDRIVGTNANDRVALQRIIKGEGDWNRDRLASLFGEDKANRIINVLDRERRFADTSQIVTRNSETAARAAAMQDTTLPAKQPGLIRNLMNLRFGDATADLGDKAIGGARSAAQEAQNAELARLLTSNDPASVTRTVQLVQAAQRRGDISAQKAKEIIQGLSVSSAQRRQPLEITARARNAR